MGKSACITNLESCKKWTGFLVILNWIYNTFKNFFTFRKENPKENITQESKQMFKVKV